MQEMNRKTRKGAIRIFMECFPPQDDLSRQILRVVPDFFTVSFLGDGGWNPGIGSGLVKHGEVC